MRRIAGSGNVANRFVDYDAATNPVGTVYTADYGNDVQDELIGIQEYAGLGEAPGTDRHVLAGMIRIVKEHGKPVGELFAAAGDVRPPVPFDPGSPHTYFPAVCLTDFATTRTIAAANFPDFGGAPGLFSRLYNYRAVYRDGAGGVTTQFGVTAWEKSGTAGTLSIAGGPAEDAVIGALAEDARVHTDEYGGTYDAWRSVTLPTPIGPFPLGSYRITAVHYVPGGADNRIEIDALTAGGAGSGTIDAAIEIYPHRIASTTDTVRLYSLRGRAVVGAGIDTLTAGLRRRDRFQGHNHRIFLAGFGQSSPIQGDAVGVNTINDIHVNAPVTDGTNGTPRIGPHTEPRAAAAHIYIHAGRYV